MACLADGSMTTRRPLPKAAETKHAASYRSRCCGYAAANTCASRWALSCASLLSSAISLSFAARAFSASWICFRVASSASALACRAKVLYLSLTWLCIRPRTRARHAPPCAYQPRVLASRGRCTCLQHCSLPSSHGALHGLWTA